MAAGLHNSRASVRREKHHIVTGYTATTACSNIDNNSYNRNISQHRLGTCSRCYQETINLAARLAKDMAGEMADLLQKG